MRAPPRAALVLAALLGTGCAAESDHLTRLVEAWGDQAAEFAAPSVRAGLVLGGMAAVMCVFVEDNAWDDAEPGDPPPVPAALWDALGQPTIEEIETFPTGAVHSTLQGVEIMDRSSAKLGFTTAPGTSTFGFEAVVIDGKITDPVEQVASPFGRIAFEVQADCTAGRNRVEGSAGWTDLSGHTQELALPADRELSSGVGFDTEIPFLPNAGNLSWTGRIDGQEVSIITYEASDIRTSPDDTAEHAGFLWPVLVHGADWVAHSTLVVQP